MNNLELHEQLIKIHHEFAHRFVVAESQMEDWDNSLILRGIIYRSLLRLFSEHGISYKTRDDLLNILYVLQNIDPKLADNFDRLVAALIENNEL